MKIASLLVGVMLSFNVNAQPAIEFVVSAAPGGPNDTVTRKLVEKLEKYTFLKFIVLNKAGAAHVIGYNYVLHSDKPTLIMSTPEIIKHDVYSTLDEVYNAGYFTNTLFVSKKSGIKSIRELADLSNTREIVFGHGGVGTYSHQAQQTVCEKTLRCLDVAYKGGSQGMLALMSGEIDAYAITTYGTKQFFENDKLVPIHNIVSSKEKSWFKLFSKNISKADKEIISNALKSQDLKFYTDMGFEK
jgi:tripartite-type tricarboxylate transporter receptor subunit TctC